MSRCLPSARSALERPCGLQDFLQCDMSWCVYLNWKDEQLLNQRSGEVYCTVLQMALLMRTVLQTALLMRTAGRVSLQRSRRPSRRCGATLRACL